MDFIEVLFILLFIVLPILEGVFRKNKRNKPPLPRSEPTEPDRERERSAGWGDAEEVEAAGSRSGAPAGSTDSSAADMVPDDLWSVLTGERRFPSGPAQPEPGGVAVEWEEEVGEGWSEEEWAFEPEPTPEEASDSWRSPIEATEVGTRAESLEYVGPEAYSLEGPLPSPEARHRAFHRMIDEPEPAVVRRPSRVARALLRPGGIRQAVIMSEVLGSPKGLEAQ